MMTTHTEANPKRDMARVRKAITMADATMEHVATPHADALLAGLANANDEFRHTLAVNAGVNDPSEATWVAFLAVMSDRVATAARGGAGPDDPDGCPAGNVRDCCGWHDACRATMAAGRK